MSVTRATRWLVPLAPSALAAGSAVQDNRYLISQLLDASLRDGSSAGLAGRLRDLAVPFCVCTGYRLADLEASLRRRAALIQKPVDAGSLLALIHAAFDGVQQPA